MTAPVNWHTMQRNLADATFAWMQEQDLMGNWMPTGGDFHEVFLGGFFTSPAWRRIANDTAWGYQEWHRPQRGCPAELAHVQEEYFQTSDDTAPTPSCRVMLPSQLLAREAGLRWSGEAGQWVNADDEVVVRDPSLFDSGQGALLIRRDFLDRFLADRGYEMVWSLLGEKLVINWDDHYPRLSVTGCARYTTTQPKVVVRAEYRGDVTT